MDVAAKLSVALSAGKFLATAIHNGASEFKFRDSVLLDYGSIRRSLLSFVPDTGLEASSPKIILHLVRHAQVPISCPHPYLKAVTLTATRVPIILCPEEQVV
jgi:hypothetical protein